MGTEFSIKNIGQKIFFIRGLRVMLDSDLAKLYEVPTKQLNLAVRRHKKRFPEDFMFQITQDEYENLRFQLETSSLSHGGRRFLPFAFTEHGVTMLASVLNSDRAIHVNIAIVRAFVQLRELLASNEELARQLLELERKFVQHDKQFKAVFEAIRLLMTKGIPTQTKIKGLID